MKRPSNATQKLRREKTRNINIKLAAEVVRENKLRRKQKLAWIDEVVKEFHEKSNEEMRVDHNSCGRREKRPAGGQSRLSAKQICTRSL